MLNSNDDLLNTDFIQVNSVADYVNNVTDYVNLNEDARSVAVSEDTITGSKLKLCASNNSLERTVDDMETNDMATQTSYVREQCEVGIQCKPSLMDDCEPALTSERVSEFCSGNP